MSFMLVQQKVLSTIYNEQNQLEEMDLKSSLSSWYLTMPTSQAYGNTTGDLSSLFPVYVQGFYAFL